MIPKEKLHWTKEDYEAVREFKKSLKKGMKTIPFTVNILRNEPLEQAEKDMDTLVKKNMKEWSEEETKWSSIDDEFIKDTLNEKPLPTSYEELLKEHKAKQEKL